MDESERLFHIRPLEMADRNWVAQFLDEHWSSTKVVSRGKAYYAHLLPGVVAEIKDTPDDPRHIGLITYYIEGRSCEILTLNSLEQGMGVGAALLDEVKTIAHNEGCKRLWLITTNDNMDALRFYQKRGFELVAIHRQALAESRKLKPQIPLMGKDNIPLRDEIELEMKI